MLHASKAQVLAAALSLAAAALPAAAANPQSVSFMVSGSRFAFAVRAGDCVPRGKLAEAAAALASLDSVNTTHFTTAPCAELTGDGELTKWSMLKTPRGSIGKRVPPRTIFLADFRQGIKRNDLKFIMADVNKAAGKSFAEVFGAGSTLNGHMVPADADEYAGYVVGTISLSAQGPKSVSACAAAMTVVRDTVFFYYKYAAYKDPGTIAGLLAEVKSEIRAFVTTNSGGRP